MKIALFFGAVGSAFMIAAFTAPLESKGDLIVIALLTWMVGLVAYTFRT